jgi:hypothetical protein
LQEKGSRDVAQAAIKMVIAVDREEEKLFKEEFLKVNIKVAAIDFGGEFLTSISKIIEKAVSVAKRDNVIGDSHSEEGSLAGAAREAVTQILQKAVGLNVGGKISIARYEDHIAVAMFFGIGMLHLNEVAIGLGHRVI